MLDCLRLIFTRIEEVVISLQIRELEAENVRDQLEDLTEFLYEYLGPYRDDKKAIYKSFRYYLQDSGGGNVFEVTDANETRLGLSVILNTNMADFLPEKFLVYIAVSSDARGQGIGTKFIKHIQEQLGTNICLHGHLSNN